MDKYLVQDKVSVRKMLKAFGKEVVCPVHRRQERVRADALRDNPEATEEYMVARLQSVMRQA